MVQSMMSQTVVPDSLWWYALMSAALIFNRSPTKTADKTPYELWKGTVPNLSFIRVWGCDAYVKWKHEDKLSSTRDRSLWLNNKREWFHKISRGIMSIYQVKWEQNRLVDFMCHWHTFDCTRNTSPIFGDSMVKEPFPDEISGWSTTHLRHPHLYR